ncbi:MAG: phospholipase D family protein, partial [Rubrivivax sp.]
MKFCGRWLLLTLCLLLNACAGLPERGAPEPSHAATATDGTPLGQIAAASQPAGDSDPSGFRLLPMGESAFSARLALCARAVRSIDAQYYHLHDDEAGKVFL